MSAFNEKLASIVEKDPRYSYEAYEFIYQGLHHTQQSLGRLPGEGETVDPGDTRYHVSGRELVEGICALAKREFGLLARTVFRQWGINKTEDWGHIVFNLVQHELMSKTDSDSLADFQDVLDFDHALLESFQISIEED